MDPGLVVQAQRGDERAFEALASGCHPRLQRVAVSILRDPSTAEDAVQQALVEIWRDLPGLRDPGRFDAWSYRVLVRSCYAEARRRPRWLAHGAVEATDEAVVVDAAGDVALRDELERAFRRLSLEQRAVVVLHHLMDMTMDQVADVLGIPSGTVASRLSRAIGAMRAAIEADARHAPVEHASKVTFR
jgi:RNA polymerase sigma-70 factor (ECF subfamily)